MAPPESFETGEYFASRSLDSVAASSAYALGGDGAGVAIAVIDTGVDQTHPDLALANIRAFDVNSADRAADDIDQSGHGTLVTGVIAADRDGCDNNSTSGFCGIQGIASRAEILDIRADAPASCGSDLNENDCEYFDSDIATAIDLAIAEGADIINLSLGGDPDADQTLETAVRRAAQAGVLVVVSAGNDGAPASGGDPAMGLSPNEPANLAGDPDSLGRVVAVGSFQADDPDTAENEAGLISSFSNRAGATQDFYILAPGEGIISLGPDDDVAFPGDAANDADDDGDFYVVGGTSFAAPQVAGALALLLDVFPNLRDTPEAALQILLDTATDYVDADPDPITGEVATAGPDSVSGVGRLNLEAAFAPQGQQNLVLGARLAPVDKALAPSGGAFGDWATASGAFDGLVFQDKYQRAYRLDADVAADAVGGSQLDSRVADFETRALWQAGETRAAAAGDLTFSWHTPAFREDPAAPYQVEPRSTFQARYAFSGGEVEFGRGGGLASIAPGVSLIDEPGMGNAFSTGGSWARVTRDLGPVSMDVFTADDETRGLSGVGLSRGAEAWIVRGAVSAASDARTAAGGELQDRFGEEDATDLVAYSLEGALALGPQWTVSAGVEAASIDLPGVDVAGVWSSRWSLGASRGVGPGALSFAVAQPRRAETGSLFFDAATGVDASGALAFDAVEAALTPSGRQIDYETRYRFGFGGGWRGEAALALSTSPNHVAGADAEGAAWFSVRKEW